MRAVPYKISIENKSYFWNIRSLIKLSLEMNSFSFKVKGLWLKVTLMTPSPQNECWMILFRIGLGHVDENLALLFDYCCLTLQKDPFFYFLDSNIAEEPLDLSGQPNTIDRSSYGPLSEITFELIDKGLDGAISLSRLSSRFLDSLLFSISVNTEIHDLAMARVEATLPNVQPRLLTLGDKLNLLLRNLREINIKVSDVLN